MSIRRLYENGPEICSCDLKLISSWQDRTSRPISTNPIVPPPKERTEPDLMVVDSVDHIGPQGSMVTWIATSCNNRTASIRRNQGIPVVKLV
ncbi:MAG TPA: hypothetical protein VNQ76_06075 [Planctomicrobium sp.]|nr:hypothetical protein [Planctomicrobium sp.]